MLDAATGLEWQRGTSPTWLTQAASVSYCDGLTLDGKTGWRLPTVTELSSLVPGRKTASPYINLTLFPDTRSDEYWSASPVSTSSGVWYVDFSSGAPHFGAPPSTYWARCVR